MIRLQELNQEVIDKHKLIFVTVKMIHKTSTVVIIFIDEAGERYEYHTPFECDFYIHHDQNIINCDYEINEKDIVGIKWDKYKCYNVNVYKQLRLALNKQIRER